MTRHGYLLWPSDRSDRGSWHVLVLVDDRGWHLRCGKTITTDTAKASPTLPVAEKTCESCAAYTLRDEDRA